MNTRTRILIGCLLVSCSIAQAQTFQCASDATIDDCIDEMVIQYGRVLDNRADEETAVEPEAGAAAASNAAEKIDQAGTATAGGQASSTITDLVPLLNMAGLLSDSDDSDGTIAVDLNFLLPFRDSQKTKHDSQFTWELDLSPTPFETLVEAIPEEDREVRRKELQEKIEDKADSRLLFTYSLVTDWMGRDYRRHEKKFANLMRPVILAAGGPEAKARYDSVRTQFATRLAGLGLRQTGSTTIGQLPADQLAGLNQLIEDARATYSTLIAERRDATSSVLKDSRVLEMAELVLQQPQLLVSVEKSFRSRLSGPESHGIKLSYEHGFVNLNGFLRFANEKREGACREIADPQIDLDKSLACLEALDEYLDVNSLESGNRLKFGLEYKKVEAWRYALADDGVDMNLPKRDRLVLSAGYGRYLTRSATRDRIDLEVAYDSNLDDDDKNKKRFVATLTYTRRLGETDVPISIVYANKSEFLEGTDKQIGVHVGIKFRTLDKD